MNHHSYMIVSSTVFLLVALMHLVRIVSGWDVTIGGQSIPLVASWIAAAVAAFLSYTGFRFAKRS